MKPAVWPESTGAMARLRQAWLIVLLFAFGWHGLVLQSHIHAPANAGMHAARSLTSGDGERRLPVSEICPIEREGAFSGAFLSPDAPSFQPRPVAVDWSHRPCALHAAHRATGHNWQSRAPPPSMNA
ncbi:hypothetical protein [Novosphingobium sp.]|uniref:hypothetical protein n=1 Tax=Novosphingobium sp. TaxID=1874826 RepID=UPI0038BB6CB4